MGQTDAMQATAAQLDSVTQSLIAVTEQISVLQAEVDQLNALIAQYQRTGQTNQANEAGDNLTTVIANLGDARNQKQSLLVQRQTLDQSLEELIGT